MGARLGHHGNGLEHVAPEACNDNNSTYIHTSYLLSYSLTYYSANNESWGCRSYASR